MKIWVLCFLFFLQATLVYSQPILDTLSEDFNIDCGFSEVFPPSSSHWTHYEPTTVPVTAQSVWQCTDTGGRWNSPGITCSNYYGGNNNLDTSYLLTPLMNISKYKPRRIYLTFDSKTSRIVNGSQLTVTGYHYNDSIDSYTTITTPFFTGGNDSTNWETRQLDITALEDSGNFYFTFMYAGGATSGSAWYLDNINITTIDMATEKAAATSRGQTAVDVVGKSTANNITVLFKYGDLSDYKLNVYDIVGREYYQAVVRTTNSDSYCEINGLGLPPGMYFVRISNGQSLKVAKIIIP